MKEGFPTIPVNAPNAQLVRLGTDLGASGAGATVWCADFAGGATLVRWSGSAWSAVGGGGGGGAAAGQPGVRTLTVAASGADYTTIAGALAAITAVGDRSQTTPYLISVGHGTYVENVVLPQWVSLIGLSWRSIIDGVVTVEAGCFLENVRVEPTAVVEAAVRIVPTGTLDAAWLNKVYAYNKSTQDAPTIAFLYDGNSANANVYLFGCYGQARNTSAGVNVKTVVIATTATALGTVEWRQGNGKTRPPVGSSGRSLFAWQRNTTLTVANGAIALENPTWNVLYDASAIWAQNASTDPLAMHLSGAMGVYIYGAAQHQPRLVGAVQTHTWSRTLTLDALPTVGERGRLATLSTDGSVWHDSGTAWKQLDTPSPSASTTWQVVSQSDDTSSVGGGFSDVAQTTVIMSSQFGQVVNGGFRFTGVNIPQGAIIIACSFEPFMTSDSTSETIVYAAEDIDNAPVFANASPEINSRNRTTSTTSRTGTNIAGRVSVDVKGAVQAVVSRSGWVSGNALVILGRNTTSSSSNASISAFDGSAVNAAKLTVTWLLVSAGGGATGRIVTVTLPVVLDGAQSIDFTDASVSATSIISATFFATINSENDFEDLSDIELIAVAGAGKVTFNFDARFAYGGAFSIQYLIGASL